MTMVAAMAFKDVTELKQAPVGQCMSEKGSDDVRPRGSLAMTVGSPSRGPPQIRLFRFLDEYRRDIGSIPNRG